MPLHRRTHAEIAYPSNHANVSNAPTPLEGSIETELFIAHKVSSDAQTTLGLRRFVGYELFSNDPQLSAEEFKKPSYASARRR